VTTFFTALVTGLGIGAVYALVAMGFSFVYRTTASFNFGQGVLVTFGSLFAYTLYAKAGLPVVLAAVATALSVGAIGGLTERVAIWPLARRGDEGMKWLMSTLGLAVIFTGIAERVWGSQPLGVPNYVSQPTLHFGSVNLATSYGIAIVVAIAIAIAIELFQRFTLAGRVMRAVGENRTAVNLAGVNVLGLGFAAFVLSGALAGLAGFVIAPVTFADPTSGFTFVILAFTALAIGGFASHWGALFGGLLVGVTELMAGTYLGLIYQDMAVFGVLVIILLISPEGLSTRHTTRRV
jgi:branched-chain amino acid transport system permease protein